MIDGSAPVGVAGAGPHPAESSERLCYEELRLDHAALLAEALTDPKVNAHFVEGGPRDLAGLEGSFTRKLEGPGSEFSGETWLDFAVRLAGSRTYVGRVEATIQGEHAELAYLLGPRFWGRGYGLEAARWIERRCSDQHGVRVFWATVAPANEPSARLLLRLGYVPVEKPDTPVLTSYDEGDLVFRRFA